MKYAGRVGIGVIFVSMQVSRGLLRCAALASHSSRGCFFETQCVYTTYSCEESNCTWCIYCSSNTDTDTLLKITQQTCMDTVKIMQCNDSET